MEEQSVTHENKDDNYVEPVYANHIAYESTVWDLKMIFGVLDQRKGVSVDQHTAVILPWMQIKLLIFFLQVHLVVHETQYGKIQIPNDVMPPPLNLPDQEDPRLKAANEIIQGLRASLA